MALKEMKMNEEPLPGAGQAYIPLHHDTCLRYDHCSSTFHVGAGHASWLLIPDSLCDSLTNSPTVATILMADPMESPYD